MSFAKHETFHIREGWLFKGMAAIVTAETQGELPTIFLDSDAPERLGIGRNMVRALRFWMQATGLAEEQKEQSRTVHRLTPFGWWLWQEDPYLDNEFSLWLVHYHLVCSEALATTWYWFFNYFTPVTFESEACVDALKLWVIGQQTEKNIVENSLRKDVHCLIRTYLVSQKQHTPEELTESPLARLNLLTQVSIGQPVRYRSQRTDANRLHPLLVLYILRNQQQRKRPGSLEVRLNIVLREPMNAGRVFNLTSGVLAESLGSLNKQYPDWPVKFERTAGLDQLTLPSVTPEEILARYAQEQTSRLREAA